MLTSFSLFFICTVSKSVIYLQITKLKIESNPFAKGFRDSASSDYYDQSLEHPSMESMMQAHHYHPQQQQQQRILEANNNMNNSLMFEKARLMMLYRPDYLASYSAAMQAATAGMSMYSPALLAAVALRTPVATLSPPSFPPSHQRPSVRYSPYPRPAPPSPREEEEEEGAAGPRSSSSTFSSCPSPLSPPASPPTMGSPPLLPYSHERPAFRFVP